MGRVVRAVTRPVRRVASAVTRTVSSAFRAVGNTVKGVTNALRPRMPDIPEPKTPAPPAPSPEQFAEGLSTPENTGRRRRNNRRNGLRIDLNTGGGGSGLNIPRG